MIPKLGAAILGTGDVSGQHIRGYQANPYVEVRAILSRDLARAAAKAAEYRLPNCRPYTDLEALLRAEDIDIVSICTPHHLHVGQGVACAQAGKHVIVEKPVALDLPGLRRLASAVRDHNVRSVVGFVLRWNPLFETIRAILAGGLLGKLFYGEVDYLHGITGSLALFPWVSRRAYGGSALLTAGCHAVDSLRWFLQSEAVEVFSYSNFSPANPLGYEYEPNSVTLIRFQSGAMGKVATSIEYVAPYTFPISLMGDRGTLRDNRLFTKDWPGQTGWAVIPTVLPDSGSVTHHPFTAQIAHFIDCIRNGVESHCNLADAVKTHEICLAAEMSHRQGMPVRLPLP